MKKILFSTFFALLATQVFAQFLFTAVADRYSVGVGETFTVTFKINANAGSFNYPNFTGFTVVGGPMTSFSNNYINGVLSVEKAASFELIALKTGTFTIGSASVKIDGKTLSTKPLQITVTEAKQNKTGSLEEKAASLAEVRILTTKRKVYVGEPISTRYTLFIKTNVNNFEMLAEPEFKGFLKNDIEIKQLNATQEEIDGEIVTTIDIAKFVLIAQQPGTFNPGKLQLRIPTQVPTGRRDWFNRPEVTLVNQISTSQFPKIEVLPLPSAGKPDDFSGGVGNYKFNVNLSRAEVKGNESVTLTVEVSGSGNIQLIELPSPELPGEIESYDPKYKESINVFPTGIKGSKRNEYLLIPRFKGVYKIPPMRFSFFDPERGEYVVLTSKELEINVTEGEEATDQPGVATPGSSNKNAVSAIGEDILFIHTQAGEFKKEGSNFFTGTLHGLLVGFLLAATFGLFILQRIRQNYNPDLAAKARKNAGSNAKKRLKTAHQKLQENDVKAFYGELTNALQQYFLLKSNVAPADFTTENLSQIIVQKGGSEALTKNIKHLINQANMARFAPLTVANMKTDYELALQSLENLEDLL